MVTAAVVLAAGAYVPVSVIVMVWPDFVPVPAVHVPVNPLVNVTAGEVGRVKAGSNVTAMVELEAPLSAPALLVRKPTA